MVSLLVFFLMMMGFVSVSSFFGLAGRMLVFAVDDGADDKEMDEQAALVVINYSIYYCTQRSWVFEYALRSPLFVRLLTAVIV